MVIKIEILGSGTDRKTYTFTQNVVSIGRNADNDVVIDSNQVSKNHCRISLKEGLLEVEDLNSTNGVRVNGKLITRALLNSGDQFRLSFAVPPIQVVLESAIDLGSLGFDAPKMPAFEEDSATIVGQAMLDEAIREQIARKASQRSSSKGPTETDAKIPLPPQIPLPASQSPTPQAPTPQIRTERPVTPPTPKVIAPPVPAQKKSNPNIILWIAGGVVVLAAAIYIISTLTQI